MPHTFNGSPSHTLGVEIELQLVDTGTRGLANSAQAILDRVPGRSARFACGRIETNNSRRRASRPREIGSERCGEPIRLPPRKRGLGAKVVGAWRGGS